MRLLRYLASIAAIALLAACSSNDEDAGTLPWGGSGTDNGGNGGNGGTTTSLTIELRLLDSSGQPTTNIVTGQPVRAQAVLKRDGTAVSNEIVQFSLEQPAELVRIDPISGSQLTDAGGAAQVTVSSLGTIEGAGRVTATATVAGTTSTGSTNFFTTATGGTQPSTLTLSAVEVSSASVSAYGTTGLRVRVLQNAQPYTTSPVAVNFTTSCPAGKATITPSATTQPDGFAVATFVDNGCAQTADATVTLTASIATDSKSATTLVRSPNTGSLRFVSVVPSDKSITLRGEGGNGRQENATVTFKLVDVAGQGVGDADVCFDSTTYVGGLNVDGFGPTALPDPQGSTTLCGSDSLSVIRYVKRTNPDGTVSVQVNSGTVPTPVRVRARAIYPLQAGTQLESYSDTLSVSTGLPLQRSFSLSVDRANIDGGNFDGEIASLTVRLADQFSNPVPDGTVVNFIGSGAAVCTADNGSCKTLNGACSCNVVSQARRPADGRVVVTAYAVGLEDFDDRNGDNVYSAAADTFTDLGDAYVDANKDGKAGDGSANASVNPTINGDTDILIPYQTPGAFKATGDGTRGTAHIRASTIIYLSQASSAGDPTAIIPLKDLHEERPFDSITTRSQFLRLQASCPQGTPVPQTSVALILDDGIGNPMAAGTTLLPVDPSDNVAPATPRPNQVLALGARPPLPELDLPNVAKLLTWTSSNANGNIPTGHSVTVRGVENKCSGTGAFAVQATSPRGGATLIRVLFEGESRSVDRTRIPVRYLDSNDVVFAAVPKAGLQVEVSPTSWIAPADTGMPDPSVYEINWGDGNNTADLPIATATQVHTYNSAGTYTVTLTVRVGNSSFRGARTVTVAP